MQASRLLLRTLALCSTAFLTSGFGFSAVILDTGFTALKVTDPVQEGRLLRDGNPSDWTGYKAFPGTFSQTSLFRYEAFTVPISPYPFLQISVDDPNVAIFASAYFNSYHPNPAGANLGLDVNYLGDAGSSGNPAGNPRFFQIFIPSPNVNQLVVVVNGLGNSVGDPFRILVEGFYDTQYNDTTPVPEPASSAFLLTGAAGVLLFAHRRTKSV